MIFSLYPHHFGKLRNSKCDFHPLFPRILLRYCGLAIGAEFVLTLTLPNYNGIDQTTV